MFEQVFVILRGEATRHATAVTISRPTDSLEFVTPRQLLVCSPSSGKDGVMTDELALLHSATQRLVRTVDGLSDAQWHEPSGLPGWTRGHVVAHLTLNAESLTGVLDGVAEGAAVPMYPSPEARDSAIAKLSSAAPGDVRERFLAAGTLFHDALGRVPGDRWEVSFERVPGGRVQSASSVPGMRLREVEVHHVDLAAGYSQEDWHPDFSTLVIEAMRARGVSKQAFVANASDLGHTWVFGDFSGPTVTGTAAELAWWLTGRGAGLPLTSTDGVLPGIETW